MRTTTDLPLVSLSGVLYAVLGACLVVLLLAAAGCAPQEHHVSHDDQKVKIQVSHDPQSIDINVHRHKKGKRREPQAAPCPCGPECDCGADCRCAEIRINTIRVKPPRSGMGVEDGPDCPCPAKGKP